MFENFLSPTTLICSHNVLQALLQLLIGGSQLLMFLGIEAYLAAAALQLKAGYEWKLEKLELAQRLALLSDVHPCYAVHSSDCWKTKVQVLLDTCLQDPFCHFQPT